MLPDFQLRKSAPTRLTRSDGRFYRPTRPLLPGSPFSDTASTLLALARRFGLLESLRAQRKATRQSEFNSACIKPRADIQLSGSRFSTKATGLYLGDSWGGVPISIPVMRNWSADFHAQEKD